MYLTKSLATKQQGPVLHEVRPELNTTIDNFHLITSCKMVLLVSSIQRLSNHQLENKLSKYLA